MTFLSLWLSLSNNITRTPSLYLINLFSNRKCMYEAGILPENSTLISKCSFTSDIQVN